MRENGKFKMPGTSKSYFRLWRRHDLPRHDRHGNVLASFADVVSRNLLVPCAAAFAPDSCDTGIINLAISGPGASTATYLLCARSEMMVYLIWQHEQREPSGCGPTKPLCAAINLHPPPTARTSTRHQVSVTAKVVYEMCGW